MKTTEERLEELETVVAALTILSACAMGAAVGDGAEQLIRDVAEGAPDVPANVRKVLHLIADAAEGQQK